MRRTLALAIAAVAAVGLVAAALAGVLSRAPAASVVPAPATPTPGSDSALAVPRADLERDLVLDVSLRSPAVAIGAPIELAVRLRNASASRTYRVIAPGDGSAYGWRPPHVYFTAQRRGADGAWEDVPAVDVGSCGDYDADWADDVVALAPGDSIGLREFVPTPDVTLALDEPGAIRLRAHYAYRPRPDQRRAAAADLAQTPDWAIASAPVELQLR